MANVDKQQLLDDIRREIRLTERFTGRSRFADSIMSAMREVPRHIFVPEGLHKQAYDNRPLSIGHGQTISQPYIVALMTDLLNPKANHVALEIGTGSGYQAAVLSRTVSQVYSTEIIPALAERALACLQQNGYHNVEVKAVDGYHGWVEHAPFDCILVTAAAPAIPPPLLEQLKPGGRLVAPVGAPYFPQELVVAVKGASGAIKESPVLGVTFVPLTRHPQQSDQ